MSSSPHAEDLSSQPDSQPSLNALEFPRLRDYLVQLCESEMGQERLRSLEPSTDFNWVCEELERVEEIRSLRHRGSGWVGGALRDIRLLLKRAGIRGNMLQPDEFLTVMTHLRLHRTIAKTLEREQAKMPRVRQLTIHLKPLDDLESRIESVISPEAMVRDNASPELARIRRDILVQQGLIRKRMEAMLTRLAGQGILREDSYTIRDGRYALPVKSEALRKVRGIVHDRSATGATIFIEPAAIVDLGNELRTLELAERDEI
ncbi:MAG: endonuclease MutS2, partial [Calditrichota bacterium]